MSGSGNNRRLISKALMNSYKPSNDNANDAGLYMWDLSTDTLYADRALADLFGLDRSFTERGLPLASYLERVVEDDRPMLAHAISQAILTSLPFQESYRVHRSCGDVVQILAFGRCFRDADNEPRFYAGIVFPMSRDCADQSLLWQCSSALETARREGRDDVSELLMEVIGKLTL